MLQGKMYRAAYGVMFTEHDDWFDAEKIIAFVQKDAGLSLNIEPSDTLLDAVDCALQKHEIYGGLPFILERADSSELLQGARGSDYDEYLLYMAGFPWETTETEFATEEDAANQIVKTIMMFTLDSVTAEDVRYVVSYFNEEFS